MIKAIIFDVDGVLIDSFEANFDFLQNLFKQCGYQPPTKEEYRQLFHMHLLDVIKIVTKSADEKEVKRIWEIGRSRETGYNVGLLQSPDGIDNVIEELSRNYLLGIVTSRIQNSVFEPPKMAELKQYFKAVVCYEDTENHKPHPDPLLLAAERLNVKSSECIYIGDQPSDVEAARAAEMKIVIYSKDKFTLADGWTSSFQEIPQLINHLEKKS